MIPFPALLPLPASPRVLAGRRASNLLLVATGVGLFGMAGCGETRDASVEDHPIPLENPEALLDMIGEAAWGDATWGAARDAEGAPALFDVAELPLLRAQVERRSAPLVEGLSHPEPRVRARAALALASVQDEGTRAPLEAALTDPDLLVRSHVAFALGQLPGDAADPPGRSDAPLLAALDTAPASLLRTRILEALGKSGGMAAVDALLVWEGVEVAEEAARHLALGRLLVRGVARNEDSAVATERRGAGGEEATAQAPGEGAGGGEGRSDGQGEGEGGGREAAIVSVLLRGLESGAPEVREASGWALSRTPDPGHWVPRAEAVRARFDALEGNDPTTLALATALGRLQEAEDTPRFQMRLAEAPDWRLRTVAARAMGVRGWVPRGAVREALHQARDTDPSGHVRQAAATALAGLLPPEPIPEVVAHLEGVAADPEGWRAHLPYLSLLVEEGRGDAVMAWVRELLTARPTGSVHGIAAGLSALVPSGDLSVTPFVLDLTLHDDPEIQGAATRALAARWDRMADAELVLVAERLAELAREGPLPAAVPAIRALGHPVFHGFGAVPALEAALDAALGDTPGTAPGRTQGASSGGNGSTAAGDGTAATAAAATRDATLRTEALLLAMGEVGDPAVAPRLEAATGDRRPAVRRAAADALEQLTGVRPRGLAIPEVERPLEPARLEALGPEPRWILETERGEIVIRLVPRLAPLTVQTVVDLTLEGAYDGTPFHRVIGAFVAQGGDVSLRDGTGTPGFAIRSEFTPLPFVRGVVGMASSGKDTEGAQFFMTHAAQPHLDGGYTAFGWVESGGEILDRILPGDRLLQARVTASDGEPVPPRR